MNFDLPFALGVLGSFILVLGAAWPVKKVKHPIRSVKNWLFAVGGVLMMVYSYLGWMAGGPIFFLLLQILVNVSSVLMMLDTDDRIDVIVLSTAGLGLIGGALALFEDYTTIIFILGLVGIGLGYALDPKTYKRNLALAIGSALIALFSYLTSSWIFFWLNVFFALFSTYYLGRDIREKS